MKHPHKWDAIEPHVNSNSCLEYTVTFAYLNNKCYVQKLINQTSL